MGGNLYSTKRIPKEKYQSLSWDVCCKIIATEREAIVAPSFKQKSSYGDLDVLCSFPVMTNEEITEIFGPVKIHRNSDVISILYDECQVDLNFHDDENFETAVQYYSHCDASNLIGRVAKSINFSLGHYGLAYHVNLSESDSLGKIIVSKEWNKILEFLGYDATKWEEGFENATDLYEWVSAGPYFSPDKFAYENLTHKTRVRDRKRPVYHGFVKWLEGKDFPVREFNKVEQLFRGIYFFNNNWFEQSKYLLEERRRSTRLRDIFSGADLIQFGLEGKELGAALRRFKDSILDYEETVLSSNKDEMIEAFKTFYF